MSNPTYSQIATMLEVPYCRGLLPSGHLCVDYDHKRGQIDDGGLVHWADRSRVERAGIRRFLKLVAIAQQQGVEPWRRLYLAQAVVNGWGRTLGVSFPVRLTDRDKLELRAMLINVPTTEPLREEAMTWAQS